MGATTAQLRKAAREAERRQRWAKAAKLYDLAAERYPRPYPKLGALGEADVASLRASATGCALAARS